MRQSGGGELFFLPECLFCQCQKDVVNDLHDGKTQMIVVGILKGEADDGAQRLPSVGVVDNGDPLQADAAQIGSHVVAEKIRPDELERILRRGVVDVLAARLQQQRVAGAQIVVDAVVLYCAFPAVTYARI